MILLHRGGKMNGRVDWRVDGGRVVGGRWVGAGRVLGGCWEGGGRWWEGDGRVLGGW